MSDIFFCYRRNDNPQTAWHLAHILNNRHKTFLDTHIRGGEPWGDKLKNEIQDCIVFVCLIGANWLEKNEDGSRRIDDPEDIVRQEIELALELGKKILPILVGDIRFPDKKDLPDKLKVLPDLEFIRLRFVPPHFYMDAREVTRRITEIILEQKGRIYYVFRDIVKLMGRISMVAFTAIVSVLITYFVMTQPKPLSPPPVLPPHVDRYDEILKRGKVVVGFRKSSTPLSYYESGTVKGFTQDICRNLLRKIFPPEVKIEYYEVFSSKLQPDRERIEAIKAKHVDIECGSTSITPAREDQVSFIETHLYTQIRFLSPETMGLHRKKMEEIDFSDKRIIYVAGTTSVSVLDKIPKVKEYRPVNDIIDLFNTLRSGDADVAFLDDVLLAGFLENYGGKIKYKISLFASSGLEQYGIMLPKDSPILQEKLRAAWNVAMSEGEICRLYRETFWSGKMARVVNEIYANRMATGANQGDDLKFQCRI